MSMMLDKFEDVVGQCELRLQVPATIEHLRTVRLVAADAADRAGFDCDETDDLRIAVDEVCHAVLKSTEAPITVGFSTEPGLVRVTGAARREGALRASHFHSSLRQPSSSRQWRIMRKIASVASRVL